MTDNERARVEAHVEARMQALLLYQELLTASPMDAVTRLVAFTRDERRRVWLEAAKQADNQARVYTGPEAMKSRVLRGQADYYRARAEEER